MTTPAPIPPESGEADHPAAPGRTGRRARWAAATAAAAAALVVGITLFVNGTGTEPAIPTADPGVPRSWSAEGTGGFGPLGDQARRIDGDPMALGAVDAPVVMVVFSDSRCPYCARFVRETAPELIDRYVEPGALRIEYRDLPLLGEQSVLAARAGRAAAAQDRYWPFLQEVFAAEAAGHPDLTADSLTAAATRAGVADPDRLAAEIDSDIYDAAIGEDLADAHRLEISSTPTFVINGHPVVGARPTDEFAELIDQLLARTS